ncbi:MAG: type II secretion system protein [Gammaproteobacteria bacterium]|nr:type II secretion system protein [Gammaproteobacteria bacterium]
MKEVDTCEIGSTYLKSTMRGFTLLELTIGLVILSFLAYSILQGVQSTRDYNHYVDNKHYMAKVKKSLITFVQSNGFLPCPDSDTTPDGVENRTAGVCTSKSGFLPFQMLGLKSEDAWGNPLWYAINERADVSGTVDIGLAAESAAYFNNGVTPLNGTVNPCTATGGTPCFNTLTKPFGVTTGSGNLTICGENTATSCSSSTSDANKIELRAIAVVLSLGANGAQTLAGTTLDTAESENFDNDRYFWVASGSNVSGSFYDDQLIWLTGYDLKYAMLRSERGLQ